MMLIISVGVDVSTAFSCQTKLQLNAPDLVIFFNHMISSTKNVTKIIPAINFQF